MDVENSAACLCELCGKIITSTERKSWTKVRRNTEIAKFKRIVEKNHSVKLESYWDLHKWSFENCSDFWEEVWNYFGITSESPYKKAITYDSDANSIFWFRGTRLNFAENLLRFKDNRTAIICLDGGGREERISYFEMFEEVEMYAAAFRRHGLKKGDKIACCMPYRKEAVFAMLAAVSIGATWTGPFSYADAIVLPNGMRDVQPKILFTVDRFVEKQVEKDILEKLATILENIQSVEIVVIVPTKAHTPSTNISFLKRSILLEDFLSTSKTIDGVACNLTFEQLPFDHPITINYNFTAKDSPQKIVHCAGMLLPLLRDIGLHGNCSREDVILLMNPVKWNLWNAFLSCFALGAAVLLYNDWSVTPTPLTFWTLMRKYKATYALLLHEDFGYSEKDSRDAGAENNIDLFSLLDRNTPSCRRQIKTPFCGVYLRCFFDKGCDEQLSTKFLEKCENIDKENSQTRWEKPERKAKAILKHFTVL